ncbi:MAG TPA: hypothetical protein VNH18_14970 [Bryobacteraceae bacterium]|nr:hypothetical protein [Bryobacteraceae bacterium]
MRVTGVSLISALWLFTAAANGQQSKPDLSGKWQLNSGKSEQPGKTTIVSLAIEHTGSSIHIVRTTRSADSKETITEFKCTTDGKDCDVKGTKVSLWWDGLSLVEMDIGNETVTKHKMTLSDDGKSLTCDLSWISPQSPAESAVFAKR